MFSQIRNHERFTQGAATLWDFIACFWTDAPKHFSGKNELRFWAIKPTLFYHIDIYSRLAFFPVKYVIC